MATQSEDKLLKYFNKLGHVDKVKAASKDTELELHILNEIVRDSSNVTWDDISGLSFAKGTLREAVILPKLIPQIFNSLLRAPPLGVLLFGPPGTGKTEKLIRRAMAYIRIGTPVNKIGYFAFTRKAANEAKDRMLKKNPQYKKIPTK